MPEHLQLYPYRRLVRTGVEYFPAVSLASSYTWRTVLKPCTLSGMQASSHSFSPCPSSLLTGGSPGAEELESRAGDRPARIFARQAQLEGLVEGGETVIENAQITLARVNRLLSDENIESVTNTLNNLEEISRALAEERDLVARFGQAVDTFNEAGQDVSQAASALQQFGVTADSFLREEVGPMVSETTAASIAVNKASTETYDALVSIRPELEAFADQGLDSLTTAAQDLRALIAALERIALQLEEDPAGFLAEPRGREVEVPQ